MPFLTGIRIEFLFYSVITKDYKCLCGKPFLQTTQEQNLPLHVKLFSFLKWKVICCNTKVEKKM